MPLFRRADGELVRDLSPVRKMVPYLMRGRNESAVYHEYVLDIGRAKSWLEAYNAARPDGPKATLFHMFLWGCAKALHERPGLNRFVSNGRIYQRQGVFLSFAAKKAFRDDAPLVTVKKEFPKDESFEECVARLTGGIREGRTGKPRRVDKEVNLVTRLPGWLIKAALAVLRWLDRHNLLPAGMIGPDPMFASLFAANLGSVGIDNTFHHLYEYGTVSLFGVLGTMRKETVLGEDGKPVGRETVQVRWTFDERINDGLYCAGSLQIVRDVVERPDQVIGPPDVRAPAA
jgi:pyruvate/2-oxoglutarate dehydrogenase complex dihydrolipoamide acyltransferase (E2) component